MPQHRLIVNLLILFTVVGVASLVFAQTHDYKGKRVRSVSINNSDEASSDSCAERMRIYSDDYADTQYSEETRVLANQPTKITASRNGGIQLRTWDKPEISVKICKAAAAPTETAAKALLDRIKLNVNGNTITVDGPPSRESQDDSEYTWSTTILVNAPAGATFDLSAQNGGVGMKNFSGNVTAQTVNGGISLDHSSGKLDIEARNGGISIKDCNGSVKANVQNGGLHIELADSWSGEGLEAHTQNGGLSIAVPKGMQSGVEVSMLGHGSVVCRADACAAGQRTWDDSGKIIRFGTGATVIRASTVNGGTIIKTRGERMGKL